MKRILPILVVVILVFSGLSIFSVPISTASIEKIKVTFSQPQIKEENGYIKIDFREANSYLMLQGKPLLPMYTKTIVYPFKTNIRSVTATVRDIETKQLDKEIVPTPEAHVAGLYLIKTKEEPLTSIYPENWFDYSVHTGLNGNERAVFLIIDIYPARYNKQDKTIEWFREIEINVDYSIPKDVAVDDKYNFVIICEDSFANYLQSFVNHKYGIPTKVVTLSDISSGRYFSTKGRDSAEQIKYFIKNAIENWNTYNVLLLGANVPSREVHVRHIDDNEIFVSDLYYADIYDSKGEFSSWDTNNNNVFAEINWGTTDDKLDLYPDVHLARIPCNDGNEVSTIVNKIINYENNIAYLQDWFKQLIAVGGDSFTGVNTVLEGEYANNYVISLMTGFSPTRIWASEGNLNTKGPLNNAINSGAGFIHFSGHGNTNIWATHPYDDGETWLPKPTGGYLSFDVSLLRNGEKLPIVVTGACSISKYNKDKNCFSYAWLKNPNGGGIASFGATALGWSYEGKDVIKGLNEGMVIETFKAYKNGAVSLGEMWTRAINGYIQTYRVKQPLDYKTILEWECFGDPTLILRKPSQSPNKPSKPIGETSGEINKEYTYQTSTTDPDGDRIYYIFDWGDGTITQVGPFESGATASATHKWSRSGSYNVRVKAKDEHGAVSDWSDPLPVRMPRSRAMQSFLLKNFQRFLKLL